MDYVCQDNYGTGDAAKKHATPNKVGAFQSLERGRTCDVAGACDQTVNVGASRGHNKLSAAIGR